MSAVAMIDNNQDGESRDVCISGIERVTKTQDGQLLISTATNQCVRSRVGNIHPKHPAMCCPRR